MGTPPAKIAPPEPKAVKKAEPHASPPPRKLTCYVMPDRPEKPGLLLISTTRAEGGCYVLGWQPQQTAWLVSEGQQWYSFADKMLRVNLAFTCVFALSVLFLLFINRRVR